jgi:hypothetical protein
MMQEQIQIEKTIRFESGSYLHVSEWDDGGVWLKIGESRSSIYTPLTRLEAEQLAETLQAILTKEVTA